MTRGQLVGMMTEDQKIDMALRCAATGLNINAALDCMCMHGSYKVHVFNEFQENMRRLEEIEIME